jgi:hypothetical protein
VQFLVVQGDRTRERDFAQTVPAVLFPKEDTIVALQGKYRLVVLRVTQPLQNANPQYKIKSSKNPRRECSNAAVAVLLIVKTQ